MIRDALIGLALGAAILLACIAGCAAEPALTLEPAVPLDNLQPVTDPAAQQTTPCRVLSALTGIPFCPPEQGAKP